MCVQLFVAPCSSLTRQLLGVSQSTLSRRAETQVLEAGERLAQVMAELLMHRRTCPWGAPREGEVG